jgi:hypothetical protein
MFTLPIAIAAILALLPYLAAAFFGDWMTRSSPKLPYPVRILRSAVLCVPYLLVSISSGIFRWYWLALYALLPVAIAALMLDAHRVDPDQRGNWRDWLVLIGVGLAVDLRWFEAAWPAHLAVFNKMLLLDAGIYGLMAMRRLDGVGFDLRLRLRDVGFGLREFCFYAPVAILLGLAVGFLHAGAARWTRLGTGDYGRALWPVALEQEDDQLQLAVCAAGGAGWSLLWASVAAGAARGSLRHYPCDGGYGVVALAAVGRGCGWCLCSRYVR